MEVDFLRIPFDEFKNKVQELTLKADTLLSLKINEESEYIDLKNERWELVKSSEDCLLASLNNDRKNSFYTGFVESISNMGYSIPGVKPELSKSINNVQNNIKEIKQQLEYLLKLFQCSDVVKNPDLYPTDRVDMTIDEKETLLITKMYELYQGGLQGYLSVKDIFYSNRIPMDYMEDFELVKTLSFAGFVEDVGALGGPAIRITTEGKRAVQKYLRQEAVEVPIPQASSVTINVGSAAIVGNGNQIHNSTISNVVTYAFPDNTNYAELVVELEQLKKLLLDRATEPEHLHQISHVMYAIQAAKAENGNKVIESLKSGGKWVLDGVKDIATDVLAEVIKKTIYPE